MSAERPVSGRWSVAETPADVFVALLVAANDLLAAGRPPGMLKRERPLKPCPRDLLLPASKGIQSSI